MVKLVVKWKTLQNNVHADIISIKYDEITTENIEKYLKETIAPSRGLYFQKIEDITQLFDPEQSITVSSRPRSFFGPG